MGWEVGNGWLSGFRVDGMAPAPYLMVENLFGEVGTRGVLRIRDRRLVLFGVIGALGEKNTFAIQAKATLKNEELTPKQRREVVMILANYADYPPRCGRAWRS